MKNATIITICVLVLGGAALADWGQDDPYKWLQRPDRQDTGIDIKVGDALIPDPLDPTQGNLIPVKKVLADDFPCKARGPITDIHIWGSWKYDEIPQVDVAGGTIDDPGSIRFRLGIWTDKPAVIDPDTGQVLEPSRPEELKWSRKFDINQFKVVNAFEGPEGWYDPNTGQFDPHNHQKAFLYNFDIPEDEAFLQEGPTTVGDPTIYWLSVDAEVVSTPGAAFEFGWKTRDPRDDPNRPGGGHFMDDATWMDAIWEDDVAFPNGGQYVPYTPWDDLVYPDPHPFHPASIDMAFVVTPEPATMTLLAIGGLCVLRRRRK